MQTVKSNRLKQKLLNNALYIVMLMIILVIACISPKFLSFRALRDILTQSATKIVMAMGCMFVIVAGGADLSGGRVVGLSAVVAGSLAQQSTYYLKFWANLPELPIIVPILAGIAVGLLVGTCSGLAVARLKVPPFLATLGMQMIAYGTNCLYFNREPNCSQPLGGLLPGFGNIGTGAIFGVPYLILIALLCMIFTHVLQNKTRLGKEIFAVGGNLRAARVSGINVGKIQIITYGLAGAFYGLAGCLEAARTGSASSTYGSGYEMDAIASCIVGGCSISGGVGSVPGVLLGVVIFNVINYGLTFIGLSSYWQFVVKGAIILGAVAIDVRKYDTK